MVTKQHRHRQVNHLAILCIAGLCLSACGSSEIDISQYRSVNDAVDAATGPLEDLNIKQREIPQPLQAALKNPYAKPAKAKCDVVKEEIATLDGILGPDMGIREETEGEGEFLSMANVEAEIPSADGVKDAAFDMAKSAALSSIRSHTDIIPFRSIVRKVTGADRYQKKVTMAYEAGKLRRAYLKGYAMERFGQRCLNPPIVVEAKAANVANDAKPSDSPPADPNE